MKKQKFAGLNFDAIQVLSQAELGKVRGGYGSIAWMCPQGGNTASTKAQCEVTCRVTIPSLPMNGSSPYYTPGGSVTVGTMPGKCFQTMA